MQERNYDGDIGAYIKNIFLLYIRIKYGAAFKMHGITVDKS